MFRSFYKLDETVKTESSLSRLLKKAWVKMLCPCHVTGEVLDLNLQSFLEVITLYQSTLLIESSPGAQTKEHRNSLKQRRHYFAPCMKMGRAWKRDVQTLLLSQLTEKRISALESAFCTYRNITIHNNDKDIQIIVQQ